MNENPFEQSTLGGSMAMNTSASSTAISGDAVEVRYPAAQRLLVPSVLVACAFVIPLVLFFVLPAPMNLLLAVMVAIMEFSTAALMWFIFNSAYVRVDKTGVTKSQLGQTKTVRWEEVEKVEEKLFGSGPTQYTFKSVGGKTLITFTDLNDRENTERFQDFIEKKLESKGTL